MTAGTRIRPAGFMNHSVSEWRVNCEMSITPPLHIDNALRQPRAGFVARDFQLRVSGALYLDGRSMFADVDRLSSRLAAQTRIIKPNLEAREEHPARRHLINKRVQPFSEQQLIVRRLAFDIYLFQRRDAVRIGDDGRQRDSGLLKGLLLRLADAADANVGLVWKMLPMHNRRSAARKSDGASLLLSLSQLICRSPEEEDRGSRIEDRGSKIEDRLTRDLRSSILDPLLLGAANRSRFCRRSRDRRRCRARVHCHSRGRKSRRTDRAVANKFPNRRPTIHL